MERKFFVSETDFCSTLHCILGDCSVLFKQTVFHFYSIFGLLHNRVHNKKSPAQQIPGVGLLSRTVYCSRTVCCPPVQPVCVS